MEISQWFKGIRMYRPIGWRTWKQLQKVKPFDGRLPTLHSAFEDGADAMLSGLALEGNIRTKGDEPLVTITLPNIKNGTWVFIPDDD